MQQGGEIEFAGVSSRTSVGYPKNEGAIQGSDPGAAIWAGQGRTIVNHAIFLAIQPIGRSSPRSFLAPCDRHSYSPGQAAKKFRNLSKPAATRCVSLPLLVFRPG